jgi:hypothetical protein
VPKGDLRVSDAWDALLPLLTRHHLVQHSNFNERVVAAACEFCGIATPDELRKLGELVAFGHWLLLNG